MELEPGQIVAGRFRVEELTEWGAVAWDESLERRVEIEPLGDRSAADARRLSAIIHPHLQAIYAVTMTGSGAGLLVREHLGGSPLGEWMESHDGQLSVDAAVGVIDPVALALEALHRADRAHGAVDAAHIRVGASFRVCLLSPRAADSLEPRAIEPAEDLRALGHVAHRLLTGVAPRLGTPASACRPGLSRAFDRPLARMLGDEPYSAETFRQRMAVAQAFAAATPLAHTILVVDRDEEFRVILSGILRQAFPDARFVHQESGAGALETLRSRSVSLVISDLHPADVDAFDLARAMRSEEPTRKTPLLVVTGTGDARDWQVLSKLGADAFLFKPVDATSLIASARRLIGAPEPPKFPGID